MSARARLLDDVDDEPRQQAVAEHELRAGPDAPAGLDETLPRAGVPLAEQQDLRGAAGLDLRTASGAPAGRASRSRRAGRPARGTPRRPPNTRWSTCPLRRSTHEQAARVARLGGMLRDEAARAGRSRSRRCAPGVLSSRERYGSGPCYARSARAASLTGQRRRRARRDTRTRLDIDSLRRTSTHSSSHTTSGSTPRRTRKWRQVQAHPRGGSADLEGDRLRERSRRRSSRARTRAAGSRWPKKKPSTIHQGLLKMKRTTPRFAGRRRSCAEETRSTCASDGASAGPLRARLRSALAAPCAALCARPSPHRLHLGEQAAAVASAGTCRARTSAAPPPDTRRGSPSRDTRTPATARRRRPRRASRRVAVLVRAHRQRRREARRSRVPPRTRATLPSRSAKHARQRAAVSPRRRPRPPAPRPPGRTASSTTATPLGRRRRRAACRAGARTPRAGGCSGSRRRR